MTCFVSMLVIYFIFLRGKNILFCYILFLFYLTVKNLAHFIIDNYEKAYKKSYEKLEE